jgi:hypothetical protein
VVLAVVAVVAHITLVPRGFDGGTRSPLGDADFLSWEVGGRASEAGLLTVRLLGNAEAVLGGADRAGGLAVPTLGDVELGGIEASGSRADATNGLEVFVVDGVLFAELVVGVAPVRLLVTISGYFDATSDALFRQTVSLLDADGFLAVTRRFFELALDSLLSLVAAFVTFPSDARSLVGEFKFSLDPDFFGFSGSVAPVRGREDTEGDWDAGVKVQDAGVAAVFLECLPNRPRTIQEEVKKEP